VELNYKILGVPKAKQSVQFTKKGFAYQPTEIVQREKNLSWDIKSQTPLGHIPFDGPIGSELLFVFPIPSGWSKKKVEELAEGKVFYHAVKPDLHDNLCKMVFDCMEGIVFVNDSRNCKLSSQKIIGEIPRIEIKIYELN